MKKFNLKSLLLAALALAVVAVALPAGASAQGRYTDRLSKRDVSGIIEKLERTSNEFRSDFDRYLDESSINGTSEEDRILRIVENYENALDRLRREFDRNDTWWQSRNNVQNVMSEARQVNSMMNGLPFARRLERQWTNMRRDINKLADTFDLPSLDGTGGGNWGGGIAGNAPSWARGTFYGRNPQNGSQITMTITANGYVTVDFGGGTVSNGTYNNERILIDGVSARVSRLNNGIRTTRTDNGERIDYFRNPIIGGGGFGGDPVSWAVGTYYGRNPQTGGQIVLTIGRDGRVSVNIDGNMTYGSADRDVLTIDGIRSRLSRIDNGIRTTRFDNGERIDYYRDRNYGGGTIGGNPVSWAVGVFYASNPQTGGRITLAIDQNGTATITTDGGVIYGTVNNDRLTVNGVTSRLTRIRDGIRTTRLDNGERIDYRRN